MTESDTESAPAVGYLRVSTATQAEEGFGLQVQEQSVREYCRRAGLELVAVFADEGVSGTKDETDRPGLASALASFEGTPRTLVVARLDRVARKLHLQEAILGTVWRAGGRVVTVDAGEILEDDPDDPMRTFVRQVMGAAAELERSMIAARMRAGRRYKASQGGYAGYGSPRFGQRSVGGELVADLTEQRAIARMVELRAAGHSLRQIARQLDEEELAPKRGARWHTETVRRVLARVDAAGERRAAAELARTA